MALYTVTSAADSGNDTLRQIITNASDDDTIDFAAGISTITLTTEIAIGANLTINGPGADKLTVSGNNVTQVFIIVSGHKVMINGISITSSFSDRGGAILNDGTLNVVNSSISSNKANSVGGAIYNFGTLTIANSTLSSNGSVIGGAIYNSGALTIANSTLSSNGSGIGGAIYNEGALIIVNSTLSSNNGTSAGGAIFNNSGTIAVSFSTIAENQASNGAGIYNTGASSGVFKNSVVANNKGDNYSGTGTISTLGVNFDTDGTCPGFTQVTSDAIKLGPLALNLPGTTETHALLNGSVAIDSVADCTDIAGNVITTDQRGVSRPQKRACDAGAYEVIVPRRGILFADVSKYECNSIK